MNKIYVVKRRSGVEHTIPVYNRSYIETPISHNISNKDANKIEALLEVERI